MRRAQLKVGALVLYVDVVEGRHRIAQFHVRIPADCLVILRSVFFRYVQLVVALLLLSIDKDYGLVRKHLPQERQRHVLDGVYTGPLHADYMVAGCNIGLVGRVVVIQVVAQAYLQVAVHTVWRYYQYEGENVVQKNCALNYSIS